jgi:hypothetical protein
VGLFWSTDILGYGNEIADGLTREGTVHQFVGLEHALGVTRQITRRKIKPWIDNQHVAMWRGLTITQRQARKLISGPSTVAKTRLISFNTIQSRVVVSLLTGHNTLRRHLYVMGLFGSALCRKYGAEDETSAYVVCECEALAALSHTYLGSLFLCPADVRSYKSREILNLFNPLKAELNPICPLLALLGAHPILHISRIRVKGTGLP